MAQGPAYHCTAEDAIAAAMRAEGATPPVVSSAGALLSGIAAADGVDHLLAERFG